MKTRQEYNHEYYLTHKDKQREYHKLYHQTHKEQRKEYYNRTRAHQIEIQRIRSLRRYYNLSVKDYDTLLTYQQNKCAICGLKSELNRYGRLCVDHSHATNQIRGLLCLHCNTGLGAFKDNVKLMTFALNYLIIHGEAIGETIKYRQAERIQKVGKLLQSCYLKENL